MEKTRKSLEEEDTKMKILQIIGLSLKRLLEKTRW